MTNMATDMLAVA